MKENLNIAKMNNVPKIEKYSLPKKLSIKFLNEQKLLKLKECKYGMIFKAFEIGYCDLIPNSWWNNGTY